MTAKFTIKEYEELALRSIKPHKSKDHAILDWTVGIGGESGELLASLAGPKLDKMDTAKELGDVIWYATALAAELDIELEDELLEASDCTMETGAAVTHLVVTASRVQEAVKHSVFHMEDNMETSLVPAVQKLFRAVAQVADSMSVCARDCAMLNAAKLAHRYNLKAGGGYSHEASAKRHDAEQKFEDTATYKRLLSRITGVAVVINLDDVEVI